MKIELWKFDAAFLIINSPTGIIYTNQTGGGTCCHHEAEGYLVPLSDHVNDFDDCNSELCTISQIRPYTISKDNEIIGKINLLLKECFKKYCPCHQDSIISVEVNLDRIQELEEAWWPVKGILKDSDGKEVEFKGYITKKNCD